MKLRILLLLPLIAMTAHCSRRPRRNYEARDREARQRITEMQRRLDDMANLTDRVSRQCEYDTAMRRQAAMQSNVPLLQQAPSTSPVLLCGDAPGYNRCPQDGALVDAVQPLREGHTVVTAGVCAPHLQNARSQLSTLRGEAPQYFMPTHMVNAWLERARIAIEQLQPATVSQARFPLAVFSTNCSQSMVRRYRSDDRRVAHSLDRFRCNVSVTYVDGQGTVLGRVAATGSAGPAAMHLDRDDVFGSELDRANEDTARRARTVGWEQVGQTLARLRGVTGVAMPAVGSTTAIAPRVETGSQAGNGSQRRGVESNGSVSVRTSAPERASEDVY